MVTAGVKRSQGGDVFGAKGKDEDLPSVRMHSLQDRVRKRRGGAARRSFIFPRMQGGVVGIGRGGVVTYPMDQRRAEESCGARPVKLVGSTRIENGQP